MEAEYRQALAVDATISVYGWLTGGKSGDLWKPGHTVKIKSPMAKLPTDALWIRAVTFTQDNNAGTQTHLELVRFPTQGQINIGAGGQSPALSSN
jgi:prophage tail gpP-like protein